MNWVQLLNAISNHGKLLVGIACASLVVVVGSALGYFAQLPVEWYYLALFAGLITWTMLLSGAAMASWTTIGKRIKQRLERERRIEHGLKNFEALDKGDYCYKCLVYIKLVGKQRFKGYSNNHTLQTLVADCLLAEDNLYDYGAHTHYWVPDHIWERMKEPTWARGMQVDTYREPWNSRL